MSPVHPSPVLILRRRPRALFAAVAGSVLALTTGCGASSSTAPPAAPPTPPPAALPTAPPTAPDSGTPATTVTVTETDFALALAPSSPAPGRYTLHVVNSGKTVHALELEGPGIEEQKTAVLKPGESADLSATLQAGEYDMYCPIDGHRGMGMQRKIKVGGAGGASAPAPAPSPGGGNGY